MGKEDYASTGGSLKLKGAKDGGIKKKKKKSRTKTKSEEQDSEHAPSVAVEEDEKKEDNGEDQDKRRSRSGSREQDDGLEKGEYYSGKTEAERRFEERKRKRMDERLKREGIKSHKQRVEEYNKYLSNLSEHHDMPRIGPG